MVANTMNGENQLLVKKKKKKKKTDVGQYDMNLSMLALRYKHLFMTI
jgi:hypothetical protein